jgi:Bifunctional DNA primase/polymerase, N-terminal
MAEAAAMSAFMKAAFGELAPYLADYGYDPVPIKPGFKAPLLDDWQTSHPPDHYLPHRDPVSGKVTDCQRWGTGILTVSCPAVDLDIRDREIVRVLIDLASEMLGPSPFRVGAPPKALLPFATAAPFDKISGRWFAMPGESFRAPAYAPHRIEVLSDGQQFVAYARHPRGSWYRWRRGGPMADYRIDPAGDYRGERQGVHVGGAGRNPQMRRDRTPTRSQKLLAGRLAGYGFRTAKAG